MKFIENLDEKEYNEFIKKCSYTSFMQSLEWGTFCKNGKNKQDFYVGVTDDKGKILCASMIQETKLLFGYSYMYAPRGYVMSYPNKKVLQFMTDNLKKYLKKRKSVYLTVDPVLEYEKLDTNANIIDDLKDNKLIFNDFINIGYRHKGFHKNYEDNQPRYTFVIPFENKTFDEVYQKFNKSMRQNIKRAEDLGVEVIKTDDVKIFYELISKTGSRDGFHPYSYEYYQNFYDTFHKAGKCELFISYIYPQKIIEGINLLKKQNENNQKSIDKLNRMLEKYQNISEEKIAVNAHMIVIHNNIATALYAGNDNNYTDTYSNYLTYYTKIKFAYDLGCKEMDLFGVPGDPKTKYKNLSGIFEFKKQFGGNLVEYFGDFDLVVYPFLYKILPISIKMYHLIRK